MKKKIILTIIMGIIITFVIYKNFYHERMNIIALGDGLSLGETAYNVQGYSFNDYIRDYYEENSILEEYITEFANLEETSDTLKMKLKNNYTLESTSISIQQANSKARILTIALGMYELNKKQELKTKDIETYLNNMEKILNFLRIYNDKKIFLISLYPSSKIKIEKISKINEGLKEICKKYNIEFIDIEDIVQKKEFFFNEESYYLNYKGHRYISEQIIERLKDK